ncbi:FG-GAP repeat domain-containing protein [Streptomyces sp. NPDC003327]
MTHHRTARVRLAAAVAAALAVTAGGLSAAVPATAAPATAPSAVAAPSGASAVVPYPTGRTQLVGAGTTGFLTWTTDDQGWGAHWTRYSDGTRTELWPGSTCFVTVARASDTVVCADESGRVTLRDMTTGQEDTVSLRSLGGTYIGAVGRTVLARVSHATGGHDVHLLANGADGQPTDRRVTGLPVDAHDVLFAAATADTALLTYVTGTGTSARLRWATVDLATAAVTETAPLAGDPTRRALMALTGKHVAWLEPGAAAGTATAVVTERGDGTGTQRITVPGAVDHIGLVGSWLTYAQSGGYDERNPSPSYAVTARYLGDGTTRKLMDDMGSAAVAPDGALTVQGGTVARGEGLYRIAPGADGAPVATQVASSGISTRVTLLGHNVPAVLDLDRTGGRFTVVWRLSRSEVDMSVTIRNTRTGETLTDGVYPLNVPEYHPQNAPYTWQGQLNWGGRPDMYTGAQPGPYTWEITARPMNGIGPELKQSGSFTVTRKPGAHDYDGDGAPDVFERDSAGRLWIDDAYHHPDEFVDQFEVNPGLLAGTGWQIYDRIESVGNVAGSAVSDVLARDTAGVLWLYQGTGSARAPLAGRVRVGSGWNAYTRLTGGSDLTGDGRSDLVATDRTGNLWLYKGTGSTTAPFGARTRIGTGWGVYNELTAVGNIAGAAAGDLVARDAAGTLWMYLGKGDGTFAPRVRIGTGWGGYDHLLGIGDANRDGRADLFASVRGGHGEAFLYEGTGSWSRPFGARATVGWYTVRQDRTYNALS